MIIMQCNFYTDNTKEIESRKKDTDFMLLVGIEGIPITNCGTGIGEYEPTTEEKDTYCFGDFEKCPRFRTKIKN
jgi:hypothetical protein